MGIPENCKNVLLPRMRKHVKRSLIVNMLLVIQQDIVALLQWIYLLIRKKEEENQRRKKGIIVMVKRMRQIVWLQDVNGMLGIHRRNTWMNCYSKKSWKIT